MGGEWARRATFAELISEGALEIGDGYRAKHKELGGCGIIFLRAGHVTDTHINFDGVDRFHEHLDLDARVHSKLARPGDAVITTKGNSTGRTAFVSESMPAFVYSPHLSFWRSRDATCIDRGFLRYWSRGPEFRQQLAAMKASTDMAPYLSLVDQKRLSISLPSILEQRAIAHILGTLDDKIELNRRMNETLEDMARALFKSWFVDFDPVRAKMDGRWRPGEPLPGLPAEFYDMFPDRLVGSEVGEVPEGWPIGTLGDHLSARRGLSYTGRHLADDGVPMHNLNSILEGGGYKYEGIKYYVGEHRDRHRVESGDLIVANTEQGHDRLLIGYAAVVPVGMGKSGIFSHHLYRVVPGPCSSLSRAFFCHLLNSGPMHQVVSGYANGTTVNMLPPDALQVPQFVEPPQELVQRFTAVAEAAYNRQQELIAEAGTLAALRDTLLPRLISGKLRARDAEKVTPLAIG